MHSLATIKIKNNALLYTFERIMFFEFNEKLIIEVEMKFNCWPYYVD
jgi:hypothetical protein